MMIYCDGLNRRDFELIAKSIIEQSKSVLDIGCGIGNYLKFTNSNQQIVAVEPHLPYIKKAQELAPWATIYNTDGIEFLSKTSEKFDCILLIDILEHLENDLALQLIELAKKAANNVVLGLVPFGIHEQDRENSILEIEDWQTHRRIWDYSNYDELGFNVRLVWRNWYSNVADENKTKDMIFGLWLNDFEEKCINILVDKSIESKLIEGLIDFIYKSNSIYFKLEFETIDFVNDTYKNLISNDNRFSCTQNPDYNSYSLVINKSSTLKPDFINDLILSKSETFKHENPKFSIIIPTHNQADYIDQSLDSILNQNYQNWEVIIVNDGSSDNTNEIVKPYLVDTRFIYIEQENGGVASALNNGLLNTSAEWICCLSPDDWYVENRLQTLALAIQTNPHIKFFHHHYYYYFEDTQKITEPNTWHVIPTPQFQTFAFFQGNYINGKTVAIHKSIFDDIGLFNESYLFAHDFEFWLRISTKYEFHFINKRLTTTRFNDSPSATLNPESVEYDSARVCIDFLNNYNFNEIFPFINLNETHNLASFIENFIKVAIDPNALVYKCLGYHSYLFNSFIEWLSSENCTDEIRILVKQLYPYINDALKSFQLPKEMFEVIDLLENIDILDPTKMIICDPLNLFESKLISLEKDGFIDEANKLSEYLEIIKSSSSFGDDYFGILSDDFEYVNIERVQHRKRILIACDNFWPSIGGIESMVEDLAINLQNENYTIEVSCKKLPNRHTLIYKKIKIIEFDIDDKIQLPESRNELIKFINFIQNSDYDSIIVLSQVDNWVGIGIGNLHKPHPKLIMMPSIRKDLFDLWHSLNSTERWVNIINSADYVISVSETGFDEKILSDYSISHVYIPHSVEKIDYDFDFRKEFGFDERPLLLMVANFLPEKNQIALIDTFKNNKNDWQICIIGHKIERFSEYFDTATKMISENSNFTIIPGLSREITACAIRDCDLLLVPSKGESAGPIVLIQAMSYGKPWIATKECNSVEYEGGGFIADVRDFPKVAEIILEDSELYNNLSQNAIEHWQSCFMWEKSIPFYKSIIENTIIDSSLNMPKELKLRIDDLRFKISKKIESSKTNPIFSVCIPTHNRASILSYCLQSLEDQNFPHDKFEIIICDDGSIDDTEEIVRNFETDIKIKYFRQENSGAGAARKVTVENADGDYLLLINDDTIALPDLLEQHYNSQLSMINQKVAVLGTFEYSMEHTVNPYMFLLANSSLIFSYNSLTEDQKYVYRFFWTCNISINRLAVLEAGNFDDNFNIGEDTELGYRLEKYGYHVIYNPHARSFHEHFQTYHSLLNRQLNYGIHNIKLFRKHPEILEKEKNIFGFSNLNHETIFQLKSSIQDLQNDFDHAIEFFDYCDKNIQIFNPNFITINNEINITQEEFLSILEKSAFIIMRYRYFNGILIGLDLELQENLFHIASKAVLIFESHKQVSNGIDIPFIENKVKPRILFTMFGWNESGGGTIFPHDVALKIANLGYEIAVFFAGMHHSENLTPYYLEKSEENGVLLYGIFNRTSNFYMEEFPELEIEDVKVCEHFTSVLDEFKPDIIHFHNFLGLSFKLSEIAKKNNLITFYTAHNYHLIDPMLYMIKSNLSIWNNVNFFENSDLVSKLPEKSVQFNKRIEYSKFIINNYIDYSFAISNREREILIDFGINPEKINVIHQPPVIVNGYNEAVQKTELHSPLKIGFIGNVMPHKGIHKLIQASLLIDENLAEFHIYGAVNEMYKNELLKFSRKNIYWHGEYNHKDLENIFKNLDLVVIPSIWEEGAGLVVLEAISNKIPVIGARIGGIPDFIKDDSNGRLYHYNSERNLAAILIELIKNPDLIIKYSSNCKTIYSFDFYIKHILSLYSKAFEGEILCKNDIELLYRP